MVRSTLATIAVAGCLLAAAPGAPLAHDGSRANDAEAERVSIMLTSVPAGVKVRSHGVDMGFTPLIVTFDRGASRTLVLSREGYEDKTVTVSAADAPRLAVRLTRKDNTP